MIRARGQFDNIRYWGIETNKAHGLYLGTYSHIDYIDHIIKNCRMKYRYWKNWHSPMIQDISLAVIVDSRIFLEVAEGEIYQTWKDDNIVDFWTFCDILSNQMIKYNPTHYKYEGNSNMIPAKHQNQSARDNIKDDTREKRGWPPAEDF